MVTSANTGVIAHGSASTDSHTMIDGYKSGMHLVGRGTGRLGVGSVTQTQEATIEELVYDAAGQGAEYAFSGVRMNMIPKEGGNTDAVRNDRLRQPRDLRNEQPRGPAGSSLQLPVCAAGVLLRLQPGDQRAAQGEQAVVLRVDHPAIEAIHGSSTPTSSRTTLRRPRTVVIARRRRLVPGRHRGEVELVRNRSGHASGHQQAQAPIQLRQHAHRQPPRQLHDPGREAFARSGVAAASVADLVRASPMDGAADQPPVDRSGLCLSTRRLPGALPAGESTPTPFEVDFRQRPNRREHLLRLRQPGAQAGGQISASGTSPGPTASRPASRTAGPTRSRRTAYNGDVVDSHSPWTMHRTRCR